MPQAPLTSKRGEFLRGVKDTIPLVVGAIPFGIIFGALAITAGLSVWAVLGLSLIVFAGSAQFVAAGLVSQGAGIALIVLTTFIVNLRHGLYAASIGPYVKKLPQRWLLPLAFWLTDETYAVVIQRYREADSSEHKHWYFLGSAVFMYVNWQICTVIGIVTGQSLAGISDWGLEFAMVVTFIGIVVPLIVSKAMLVSAVVAGTVAVLLHSLPNQVGLISGALAGIAAGVLVETVFSKSPTTDKQSKGSAQ